MTYQFQLEDVTNLDTGSIPNVSFGEKSCCNITINNQNEQYQDGQNTKVQTIAKLGEASIINNQSTQTEISLMQASIQRNVRYGNEKRRGDTPGTVRIQQRTKTFNNNKMEAKRKSRAEYR